ncbi:LAMI_0F03862g1_1 [Lachancea mirantina]|uniref:LAMI_0F03862g1_1 n=1 Tax=Lachancea mirantina TaxID=1230905 RepID=A0A1G4JXD2_9SACH|nr:LAMI_0F03862g1_1 [Lachancea mirantina]
MTRSPINLDNVYENNLGTFKKISDTVLPVSYPEKFFSDQFSTDAKQKELYFSKLAYFGEVAVGGVRAKLIANKSKGVKAAGVYIEILVVLEPYRSKGIGSKLLEYVIDECKNHFQHQIFVHVATNNSEGLKWYETKGFVKQEELKDYYKDTRGSPDAVVLCLTM